MSVRKRQEFNQNEMLRVDMNGKDDSGHAVVNDRKNIALLFFLYTLQGIPLGLSAAIPMILQNRGVSYKEQAEFSFVSWPFSLKLLWAPIVDSLFLPWLGRRKTWLIPTQYLLGITMYLLSVFVNDWLGDDTKDPNIGVLTMAFFFLNFLAATQDIVVDGWALTILHPSNVGHASTCNSTGQTTGYFLGYVLFIALESVDFCNKYIRSTPEDVGLVTLSGFLYFWSIVFIVTTTLVAIFKHEKSSSNEAETENMNIKNAYTTLLRIIKLPSIRTLSLILLTAKIGFSATDAVSGLKILEGGLPKETLGFLAVPLIPLQILLVFYISKWTSGPRPMDIYMKAVPYRLMFGFVIAAVVWLTPRLVIDGNVPISYSLLLLFNYAIHQVLSNCMFVAIMAFFAKISDPTVGGTYMTLLNTLCNLGGNWPSTLALWLVDGLTWNTCEGSIEPMLDNACISHVERKRCTDYGGHCKTIIDGYYLETLICFTVGYMWLMWVRKKIVYLQSLNESAWRVDKAKRNLRR